MDIKREDPNYKEFVDNSDQSHYLIYAQKLEPDTTIQCPNDPNMLIQKCADGKIKLSKKGSLGTSLKIQEQV